MRIIPPIKSIIYFEAAARLQSFKLAAIELNVTSGAISQQIMTLESFIGKKLFDRSCRQVKLTHCGLRYYSRIYLIIQNLEEATTDLGIGSNRPKLKIAVPPSLLKNWLLPRIIDSSLIGLNRNIEFIDTLDYLDFSKFKLENKDFGDLDHLNYKGAKIFSVWFSSILEKGLIEAKEKETFIENEIQLQSLIK